MSLGEDFTSDAMEAFSGELEAATLTRLVESAYDPNNATGASTGGTTTYPCEGIAFTYKIDDIDGTRVVRGDYRVVILRGSIAVVPQPGDSISIPPPGQTVAKNARVVNVEAVTEAQVTIQVRGTV